ncbi:MAG: HAD-IIA family hydrolase [Candidatus Limnocylindrales bacterium]
MIRTPNHLYRGYILDLDGTVYLGERLLPTAGETIARLRELGSRTVFLSNNPTHARAAYADKLTSLGLPTPAADILTSSQVLVEFLRARLPGARLFVLGEQPLMDELAAAGFRLVGAARETDAVIASFDRTFVYGKLQVAFDAIRSGARFFATNPDRYCPVPGGGQPDAASIIAAIEACTGVTCEAVVGKPSTHMVRAALRLVGLPAQDCLMTGDRLETDVRMGLEAGMDAALVLTGATAEAALSGSAWQPTYVLRHLADLLPDDVGWGRTIRAPETRAEGEPRP